MSLRAHLVPDLHRLVEIGECEREHGGHPHQAVLPDERTTGECGASERAHALGRTRALGPLPRSLDGETAGPEAA